MKLRNKQTGEIIIKNLAIKGHDEFAKTYNSLAELNEEWEDYEEPKEYWYIDDAGVIQIDQVLASEINMRKSIGNYFETREEAEKAVEKLKAWKRLKDNGFMIAGWDYEGFGMKVEAGRISFEINKDCNEDKDLDICFGGEE